MFFWFGTYTKYIPGTSQDEIPGDPKLCETATWLETDSFEHQASILDVSLDTRFSNPPRY
jgi:hypothetical protein